MTGYSLAVPVPVPVLAGLNILPLSFPALGTYHLRNNQIGHRLFVTIESSACMLVLLSKMYIFT